MAKQSEVLFQRAQEVIPGGVNSPVRAFRGVGGAPLFIEMGQGSRIFDADNLQYIDCVGSWGPMILGHGHRYVVEAVKKAATRGFSFGAPTAAEIDLAEMIIQAVPSMEMVRLVNSGTEATMSALRLARAATGRKKILKFEGGYHGHVDSLLVKAGSGGATFNVPDSAGVPEEVTALTLIARYNDLEDVRSQMSDEVAAIIVEPVAGNMGCIPPAEGFLAGLRAICDEHGILLIFDEVQCGVGRTGRMFAAEHEGVAPDIMTLAKGLGSGLPIGAMVAKRRIMEQWKRGAHGNTYGGNPLSCAAANATLDLVNSSMAANAAAVGTHFASRLRELAHEFPCIGDVRGRGLMLGIELIGPEPERVPARDLAQKVIERAFHNGLLLLTCGLSTVRFMPPLNVTAAQVDEAVGLLRTSLSEALSLVGK